MPTGGRSPSRSASRRSAPRRRSRSSSSRRRLRRGGREMTTPRRLPRPVTQPAAGDDQPNRADDQTVAEVLPLSALATPAEPGEAPAGDRVKSPSGDPSEAEVIASVHPTPEAAGEAFLAMV